MTVRRLLAVLVSLASLIAQAAPVAFTNVRLPGDDAAVTVLVDGMLIRDVGAGIKLPKDTRVIEGNGAYLSPGLAEMHGHTPVPFGDHDQQFVRDMMFLYVANGVTLVRGMLGAPGQLELRDAVDNGEMLGPTLFIAGPSFSGNSIGSPGEARARVREQKQAGWDLLKVHPGLTRAEYDAMALEAHARGIRFGGHVPASVGLVHAIGMGQHTFDHIDGYLQHLDYPARPIDTTELDRLVSLTREAGAWIVPTLVLWDHVIGLGDPDEKLNWPENAFWPRERVMRWQFALARNAGERSQETLAAYSRARSRVLAALHAGGVPILMGTDSPQIFSVPGFSIHREMAAMEAAGMSAAEVWRSGTENVARYLTGHRAVGRVAPGFQADLILVEDDPTVSLATLASPLGVMVRGRWLSAAEIAEGLAEIRARQNGEP